MPDTTVYVDQLAGELNQLAGELNARRPDVLRAAEDELQRLRHIVGTVARFLHNPAIALDIRQNLARDLQLPTPER